MYRVIIRTKTRLSNPISSQRHVAKRNQSSSIQWPQHLSQTSKVTLKDGNKMPIIGVGTWKSKPNEVKTAIKQAVRLGYRHIDCAFIYHNEREVGEAIIEALRENNLKREDLFITSKLWNTEHIPERVSIACEQTIHSLQLEYLDCYLMHWPVAFKPTGEPYPKNADGSYALDSTPLWETWEAMQELLKEKHVKTVGVCNFTIPLLEELIDDSDIVPTVNQVEFHPYLNQQDLLKYCKTKGIQLQAYSPLGTGPNPHSQQVVLLEDLKVKSIAAKHNKTAAQILLRWGLQHQLVVLPKSINPQRLQQNLSLFDFSLDGDDMNTLNTLHKNIRYVNPEWGPFQVDETADIGLLA